MIPGFLVALINKKEHYHSWIRTQLSQVTAPLLTCEPVITESCFLLRNIYGGEDAIMGLIEKKKIIISFNLAKEIKEVKKLMQTYKSVPMSLADGCLVRMSEIYPNSLLLTLDRDFIIYRRNKNQVIDLIIPDEIT